MVYPQNCGERNIPHHRCKWKRFREQVFPFGPFVRARQEKAPTPGAVGAGGAFIALNAAMGRGGH